MLNFMYATPFFSLNTWYGQSCATRTAHPDLVDIYRVGFVDL